LAAFAQKMGSHQAMAVSIWWAGFDTQESRRRPVLQTSEAWSITEATAVNAATPKAAVRAHPPTTSNSPAASSKYPMAETSYIQSGNPTDGMKSAVI